MYTFKSDARAERRMVQRFTEEACKGRQTAGDRALDHGVRCLRALEEAGVSKDIRSDIAGWLWNAMSDLGGELSGHLDNVGLVDDHTRFDLGELETIMATVA